MNNINVTIELCAEDRARLDNILAALQKHPIERAGEALHNVAKAAEAAAAAAQAAAPEVKEAPAQEAPAPAEELPFAPEPEKPAAPAPEKPAAPEVTTAELQSKVVQLVGAGKKDATRAIIMEYAKSVGEIPADKRAEVLGRLNALEG